MMKEAQKYLLDIGFDEAHLPELFNDDDKSTYTIPELMEGFAKSQPKWISVEDRMPDELSKLLIYIDNQQFITNGTVERNNIGEFEWREMYHGAVVESVTHWKPLPNPPQTKQV